MRLAKNKVSPSWQRHFQLFPLTIEQLRQMAILPLVMGNEGQGISQDMAESANQLVHINMPGRAESLNVAVAAGILMFSL